MRFTAGDTVICVDDTVYYPNMQRFYRHWPRIGDNYIIRAAVLVNGREGVYLQGIFNEVHPLYGEECGYFGFRFAKAPRIAHPSRHDSRRLRSPDRVGAGQGSGR
jgi:hypothetical protein